mgnify:CR=1 FL=1
MRKTKVRLSVQLAALLVVITMLFSTSVFAASGKTVEVRGYVWEGMSEEQIAGVAPQFSVSNVIDTFDAKKIDPEINAGLIVEAPSTITVLVDGGVVFNVFKLTKTDDNTYTYYEDQSLPVSGNVSIFVIDESGEYVEKIVDTSELDKYSVDYVTYLPGCSVTLTEPGDYYVIFRYEAIAGAAQAIITVKDSKGSKTE